ncbi:hypothetical protein ACFCX4_00250 [Kitasatospora sp. NPDC056327]|uniref:hypothetical protein n=1 Tax=Kitasatospora sp. NPDC056327 TaxID=3345785 RepID=UPI0035D6CED6
MEGADGGEEQDGEVLGPDHPLVCSTVPLPPPLTTTAPVLLNTGDLSWEAVEHLVVALAREVDQAREARLFGRRGQKQQGIDVVAFFDAGPTSVYQAKRYSAFTAADLRKAVGTYADGPRPFSATRLVVVTSADASDTKVVTELAALRNRHCDLVIELWDQGQLSDLLRERPGLVRRFFGEATMQAFCRPQPQACAGTDGVVGRAGVEAYRSEVAEYLADGLHELVPALLRSDRADEVLSSADLASRLMSGSHVQLVGPSGAGKTHTLTHIAVELARSGWLPLLVGVSTYGKDRRFEDLLDDAVEPFSSHGAQELVEAAQRFGVPVAVLLDAVNECPESLRKPLVQQLSAWCRRMKAMVLLSSQEYVAVPSALVGLRLSIALPDAHQRRALLDSYGADGAEEGYEAFTTAFELSLAAQLASQLPAGTGRGGLLDAFIRERLRATAHPAVVRQVLRRWALVMDERLVGWLALGEAEGLAAQVLASQALPVKVVDEVLRSPLIQVRQQRLSFRHELFGRLLAAEELLWGAGTVADLVSSLGAPQRRDLASLVVALVGDHDMVRDLLRGLTNNGLARQALAGRLSPVAFEVALSEAAQLLDRAVGRTAGARVEFMDELRYRVVPPQRWSPAEMSLFSGIGLAARSGYLLDLIAALLRESERACHRGAVGASEPHRKVLPSLIAAALYGPVIPDGERLPADVILESVSSSSPFRQLGRHRQQRLVEDVERWVGESSPQDIGVLMLACLLLRFADTPEAACLAPKVISLAWASGAAHLQMAAMDLALGVRSAADKETTAAICAVLDSLQTDDVWVSTVLVDALNVYGLIESLYAPADIAAEIAGILTSPHAADASERARWILYSQFEDAIAAPFCEVLDSLSEEQLVLLHSLALVGSDANLFTDILLKELIKWGSPAALPAYTYWAGKLDLRGGFVQDAVSCHLLGIRGCAAHLAAPPPLMQGHSGPDADAWRYYGQIAFWLARPSLGHAEVAQRCQPLWGELTGALLDAAVDPLHRFKWAAYAASQPDQTFLGRITAVFPDQVRDILHHGLQAPEKITTLASHPLHRETVETVIQLLAQVGNQHSVLLLSSYLAKREYAVATVSTIRHLKNQT